MFRLIGRIPKTHFHLACSGGSDSMIFVDFLQRYPKHKFDLLYFNPYLLKPCIEQPGFKIRCAIAELFDLPLQIICPVFVPLFFLIR